jgi:hypothetical protein
VTGSTEWNGATDRNLSGKRTIQKNAAERGSTGAGTTVSFGSNNPQNLQTNSRSGHSISKISHRMDSSVKV